MRQALWMCLLATLTAGAVVAPSASADEFAAGDLCSFPVVTEEIRSNGRTSTQEITNTLSGESISVLLAGSATFTDLPNGDFRVTARGHSLGFYFAGDVNGPGLFLTKGRVVDIFDAATGAVTSSRVMGQRIDLCAQLS